MVLQEESDQQPCIPLVPSSAAHPVTSSETSESEMQDFQESDAGDNDDNTDASLRLNYEVLQSFFHLSLRDAAAALGVCATTLKRACRRVGIKRW